MTAYEKMMLRSNISGNTIREQMINNSRDEVEALLSDDPSYKENVEILNKGFVNLRMNQRELIQGIPTMKIQSSLSENDIYFVAGDTFFYDDGYWLCTDSNIFHDIYRTGKVEECNYLLKWQNPRTLDIVEKWCVVKSPYSSGIDESNVVTTGKRKFKIKLPYDDETKLFHLSKRFLIDIANNEPIAYKLIEFDGVTNKNEFRKDGFLVIVVQQDELQDDDNKELMVADYIPQVAPPSPIAGICEITYKGEPIMRINGSSKRFTAVFKDADGNELTGITPNWNLDFSVYSEIQNKITILSANDNDVVIDEVPDDNKLIGKTFVLKLEANDATYGNFEYGLVVEVGDSF